MIMGVTSVIETRSIVNSHLFLWCKRLCVVTIEVLRQRALVIKIGRGRESRSVQRIQIRKYATMQGHQGSTVTPPISPGSVWSTLDFTTSHNSSANSPPQLTPRKTKRRDKSRSQPVLACFNCRPKKVKVSNSKL